MSKNSLKNKSVLSSEDYQGKNYEKRRKLKKLDQNLDSCRLNISNEKRKQFVNLNIENNRRQNSGQALLNRSVTAAQGKKLCCYLSKTLN